MDINKALRKQKKSYKRFLLSMGFIFLALPTVLLISEKIHLFLVAYLGFIECLVLIAIFLKMNSESLWYEYKQYKLEIKQGIINSKVAILCDKVVFIDVERQGQDIGIIMIASSKFRNKNFRLVEPNFLLRNSTLLKTMENMMKQHPENKYYYMIVKEGGFLKYKLLDAIYTSCVYAFFTDRAIEAIKECRG